MPKNDQKGFRFSYEVCQTANKDEAEIMVYNEIVSYKWSERDPEITAQDFDKLLKDAKASGASKLRLRINCPGGSVWQAVAMKAMLDNSNFEEINVDIEGLCASAATFFVCCRNAHVRIAQGSEFMIHNPRAWGGGTADDFSKTANRLYAMQNDQHDMYAEKTGKTPEQIKEWMDAETWFTAKEAVANGFADELMQSMDAAACVSTDCMEIMKNEYVSIPEEIAAEPAEAGTGCISNTELPVANNAVSENTKNTHKEGTENMNIKELTADQLLAENPDLYNEIVQRGTNAERERIQEIDALTDEGFEEMAETAKANGTSPADFIKEVVKSRAERKKTFMSARAAETAPAQNVTGGSASENDGNTVEKQIADNAKEMAEFAKEYGIGGNAMY